MLGETPEQHAQARELVSIFEEATAFFGIWARQGSRLNADRHRTSAEAAEIGAERFASKLRVAETKLIGPFLSGAALGKRSQKGRVTWASYKRLLTVFPLPEPVIHQAWHR